jgi:hypothetical protein
MKEMQKGNARVHKYDSVKDIVENDVLFNKWLLKPKKKKKQDEDEKKDQKNERNKKNGTRANKLNTMKTFIHFLHNEYNMTDATPTKLITHALAYQKIKNMKFGDAVTPEDYERVLLAEDDEIGDHEQLLLDFKAYLELHFKGNTAKTSFNRLLNYYRFYKVDVSEIDTNINAHTSSKSKKAPDFKLLQKAFRKATLRNKCIISCGVTSGMARLDITTITYGEFEDGLQTLKNVEGNPILDSAGNEVEICILDRGREKNFNEYHTFFAPETVRCIKEYVAERNNPYQNPEKLDYFQIYSKSDKLFITAYVRDKFRNSILKDENGNVVGHDDSIRALTPDSVSKMYGKLREKMQLPHLDGEYSTIRSHAMRHYFSNNYRKIDPDYKEHWLGHAGNKVKVTYEDYNPEEGLEIYLKGLDGITIDEVVNYTDITSPSVEKMKANYESELQQRDQQQAQILERLKTLESKDQLHNTIDILKGQEVTNTINGETYTSTIDENNHGVMLLRAYVAKMNSDPTWDPEKASEEELDAISEAVRAERMAKADPEELMKDPLVKAVMQKLMAQEE